MKKETQLWRDKYFWALLLVSVVAIFFRLGAKTLWSWDEAIYAQVAREMLYGHHWLVPYWQAVPWFEKPPLALWCMILSFRLFGISEFAARIPAAVASLASLSICYLLAKRLVPRYIALIVGFILLTSYLFLYLARFATTDMLLVSLILGSIFGLVKLLETKNAKWWLVVSSATALAFMTKNVAALPMTLAILVVAAVYWRNVAKLVLNKWFVLGVIVFLAIILPWHIYMYKQFGQDFVDQYLGYHILSRGGGLENHQASPYDLFYPHVMATKFWYPWAYLAAGAVVAWIINLKKFAKQQKPLAILLLAWLIATIVMFQLSGTKLFWYMLPIIPPLSIMIGWLWWQVWQHWRPLNTLLLFAGFGAATYNQQWALLAVLLILVIAIVTNSKAAKRCSLIVVLGVCFLLSIATLRPLYQRAREFIEPLGKVMPISTSLNVLILYKSPIQGPAQIYYTNRIAIPISNLEDLKLILQNGYQKSQHYTPLNPVAAKYANGYLGQSVLKEPSYVVVAPKEYLDEIKQLGNFNQTGIVEQYIVGTIVPAE